MKIFRWATRAFIISAIAASAVPAFAGANPSDITGPNVSDITGFNPSDITGTDTSNASLTQQEAELLADSLEKAYEICAGGGDCTAFYSLYDQANEEVNH